MYYKVEDKYYAGVQTSFEDENVHGFLIVLSQLGSATSLQLHLPFGNSENYHLVLNSWFDISNKAKSLPFLVPLSLQSEKSLIEIIAGLICENSSSFTVFCTEFRESVFLHVSNKLLFENIFTFWKYLILKILFPFLFIIIHIPPFSYQVPLRFALKFLKHL